MTFTDKLALKVKIFIQQYFAIIERISQEKISRLAWTLNRRKKRKNFGENLERIFFQKDFVKSLNDVNCVHLNVEIAAWMSMVKMISC